MPASAWTYIWSAPRLTLCAGYAFTGTLPRTGAEARAAHDGDLWRLLRLWMANRGVWEAMEWAGPTVSVPATETDVGHYVEAVSDLTEALTA